MIFRPLHPPSFCHPGGERIRRPPGKESLSCDKTSPFPSPRVITEPLPGTLLTSLEGTPAQQTMGGRKGKQCVCQWCGWLPQCRTRGLYWESPCLEVPWWDLLSLSTSYHPGRERKFQAVGTGPLSVGSRGSLTVKGTLARGALQSFSGLHWSGNSNYPNHSSAARGEPQEEDIWTSREKRGPPKHTLMFFSEERLLIRVSKTGPPSVVLPVSGPTADEWAIRRNRRGLQNKEPIARVEMGETGDLKHLCSPRGPWGASFLIRVQKTHISAGLDDINPAQYVLAANKMTGPIQKIKRWPG